MSTSFAPSPTALLVEELVVACGALVRTRVTQPRRGGLQVCLECQRVDTDLLAIPHLAACRTGQVTTLLVALARAEAAHQMEDSPAAHPPTERSRQGDAGAGEPASAAVPQPRPRVLPFLASARMGGVAMEPSATEEYFEPWAIEDGELRNAAGDIVLDPQGSTVMGEHQYMRRIAAVINLVEGIPTAALENAPITRVLPRGGVQ